MLIDAPPTLLNTIHVIYKKHLCHLMAKSMNELGHKSPFDIFLCMHVVLVVWCSA